MIPWNVLDLSIYLYAVATDGSIHTGFRNPHRIGESSQDLRVITGFEIPHCILRILSGFEIPHSIWGFSQHLIFLPGFESPHRILTGVSHEDPHKI